VAATERSLPGRQGSNLFLRWRWTIWVIVLLLGIGAGVGLFVLRGSPSSTAASRGPVIAGPDATWAAGARPAPGFRLEDQTGRPVSLAADRGRPVIVTFIDPLCRTFCPLEAKRLNDVVHSLPPRARPAILAVSVNVYGNARANLLQDVRRWRLVPEWRWAVGSGAQLASVWRRYQAGVLVTTKKIAGVTVHEITHTEAAYLVDRAGYERALFLWPFSAADVERSLRQLASSPA
jgi:cytochrome oxidase Cu insertion factor (SCO1/SenC/PrrC family)